MTDEGNTHFEAFQVTDQCVKLYQANLFRPSKDPKVCKFGEQVLMFKAGQGRKESDEVETTVLLKPVCLAYAIRKSHSDGLLFRSRLRVNIRDAYLQTFRSNTGQTSHRHRKL